MPTKKVALGRQPKLTELETFLVGVNLTLFDWASGFVTEGMNLGALLAQRADATDRAKAGALRSYGVGLLNRMRTELAVARRQDPTLPGSLDEKLFAYADMLEETSAQDAAAEKKAEKAVQEAAEAQQ